MRRVLLNAVEAPVPQAEEELAQKTRHLLYRMEEFLPDGMQITHELREDCGVVKIRVPGVDSERAAEILRQEHGVESAPVEGDMLVFRVTGHASFEDMDYVQGAVTELFYL